MAAFSVVPVFLAVAVVVVDFLVVAAWCVVAAVFEVAVVSFLFAQDTKNANVTTVIKDKANLFIEMWLMLQSVRPEGKSQAN